MHGDFKGTVFQKNESLKPKLLYVYTENTLNGEINTKKNVYISVNNNTNFKKLD